MLLCKVAFLKLVTGEQASTEQGEGEEKKGMEGEKKGKVRREGGEGMEGRKES